jgi:hypothetical protein
VTTRFRCLRTKSKHRFRIEIYFQVDCLLCASLFSLPSYTYQDIGDVLFELMLLDRVSVCHWLEASLKNLPGVEGSTTGLNVKQRFFFVTNEEAKEAGRMLDPRKPFQPSICKKG